MTAIFGKHCCDNSAISMEAVRRWIFSDEELKTTPNKFDGLSRGEEMNLRYNSALMIQELGEKLNLLVFWPCLLEASLKIHAI